MVAGLVPNASAASTRISSTACSWSRFAPSKNSVLARQAASAEATIATSAMV